MLLPNYSVGKVEAGVDEVGRGCLAGPVVAAAVILPDGYQHPLLNDSKKLSATQRNSIEKDIRRDAICFAIAEASAQEIDAINILQASFLAMHRAIAQLSATPELLLIDGNRFKPYSTIPFVCIVKGDATYASIAAASVLAKTHRDRLMASLAESYPGYGWENNAGYPTAKHREAIASLGNTPYHRLSFNLLGNQLGLWQ